MTYLYDLIILLGELVTLLYCSISRKHALREVQMAKWKSVSTLFRARIDPGSYWFHAVSLGEVKAAEVMAQCIVKMDRDAKFILTTTSRAGFEYGTENSTVFQITERYCPDLSFFVFRIFRKIKPKALIVIDSDLWLNQLGGAKRSGAKVFIVNGTLSPTTTKRYQLARWFGARLFGNFTKIFAQSQELAERFIAAGANASIVEVGGNVKVGANRLTLSDVEYSTLRSEFGLAPDSRIVTVGSIHPQEFLPILVEMLKVLIAAEDVECVFVPRHPLTFPELESALTLASSTLNPPPSESDLLACRGRIRLVRKMGVLRRLYAISRVAIVGGTFCEVNGHNLIEPSLSDVPVLFGPYTKHQSVLRELVLKYRAGLEISNAQSLADAVLSLLSTDNLMLDLIDGAKRLTTGMAMVPEQLASKIIDASI